MIDLEFVRGQFPAFGEASLKEFAFFENAGGSYACGAVVDALDGYYRRTKIQPYYAAAPSREAGEAMDRARSRMADWLNVAPDAVHFGPSTTQNTYVLAQALRGHLDPGDQVVVTNQDHEANIGFWRRLADDGIVVREWCVDADSAELTEAGLDAVLNERTRVVAFTHCSNIVGSIHPVADWTAKVRDAGAISIVDGVSFAPHGLPDVDALGADVYLFSLYKVYGPHQGVMVLRPDLGERLPNQAHFFNAGKPTARFTPAGPDHAQIAAVNGVIDYFEALATHHGADGDTARETVNRHIRDTENALVAPLLRFLDDHPSVRLIGRASATERAPTVSITVADRSPAELGAALAERGIGIGYGNCYAWRLMEALDIPPEAGVARMSLVHYTSAEDVERLLDALDQLL